jgi:dienelactone hydrolase
MQTNNPPLRFPQLAALMPFPLLKPSKSLACGILLGISMISPAEAQQEAADPKAAEEYRERLERANPDADPKQHKALAAWCKRKFPEQEAFHQNAYNEFVFEGLESNLPPAPTAVQLKRLQDEAAELELHEKSREYLGKWGELQFATFAAKLKPGDVKMMQTLFKWSVDNGVTFIEPVQDLAADIIELEPGDEAARKVLGHLRIDGEWNTPAEAFGGINLKSPTERVELHRKLAESTPAGKREYPANPVKGMEKVGPYYLAGTAASGGGAKYFLCINGYSKTRPCPLIISLHGGGSGGFTKAKEYASYAADEWARSGLKGGSITIAPIARNHNSFSWNTLSNFEDLIDAIEETAERFNIDRKRIYITGQSMGGGGTGIYYQCFPEWAAASCSRAGAYMLDSSVGDVLGKPILVIHGEKDTQGRNDSRDQFIKKVEGIGGKVTHISLPEIDHFIPVSEIYPKMVPFFEQHVNDMEPDFRLIRAAGRLYFKN